VSVRLASKSEGANEWQLPSRLSLLPHERSAIEAHIFCLDDLAAQTPTNGDDAVADDAAAETNIAVTKMMLALPAERAEVGSAVAQADAYAAALDDVPSWAVALAMRRWYRGEAGVGHDYNWRPKPAVLRKIAMQVVAELVTFPAWQLRKLLAAEPLREHTPEEREVMKVKLRALGLLVEESCQ
jgi:hypothetical protein